MARTTIDFADREFLYLQLADIIRHQIVTGKIAPRHAVPSKRQLREEHGVSARVVDQAMAILKDEHKIEFIRGKGLYVLERKRWR